MKTAAEIQLYIFNETGLKTSVSKGTGSMKGYLKIFPIFQGGIYPNIPHPLTRVLFEILKEYDHEPHPVFCTISEVCVYGLTDEREEYKKERKPKLIDATKPQKGWGSKNSQMRLDKATARNAAKMRKGNTARYY